MMSSNHATKRLYLRLSLLSKKNVKQSVAVRIVRLSVQLGTAKPRRVESVIVVAM